MDIQSLKIDLIHWLTEIKDKNILDKIYALKEDFNQEQISIEQQIELNKRLEKFDKGEMNFKSWDDTKASVRSRAKNVS